MRLAPVQHAAAAASAPVVVMAAASSHLELTPAAPRLNALDALLQVRARARSARVANQAGTEMHAVLVITNRSRTLPADPNMSATLVVLGLLSQCRPCGPQGPGACW